MSAPEQRHSKVGGGGKQTFEIRNTREIQQANQVAREITLTFCWYLIGV
jgi:hypothetical protein